MKHSTRYRYGARDEAAVKANTAATAAWRTAHPGATAAIAAAWRTAHPGATAAWRTAHPDKARAQNAEVNRKGGKHYEKHCLSHKEGLSGEKEKVRGKHQRVWTPFKRIIAPESQIHHQWIPGTANYTGVALVEAKQHRFGYIDVIEILEGKITLFTEKEVRETIERSINSI